MNIIPADCLLPCLDAPVGSSAHLQGVGDPEPEQGHRRAEGCVADDGDGGYLEELRDDARHHSPGEPSSSSGSCLTYDTVKQPPDPRSRATVFPLRREACVRRGMAPCAWCGWVSAFASSKLEFCIYLGGRVGSTNGTVFPSFHLLGCMFGPLHSTGGLGCVVVWRSSSGHEGNLRLFACIRHVARRVFILFRFKLYF